MPRRVCATIAVSSAVLHALALGSSAAFVGVLMIVGCLSCAWHLWWHDSIRAWLTVALMNLAMIAVHLPMSAGHHHNGGPSAPPSTLMTWGIGAAIVEVGAATLGLYLKTRSSDPDQRVDPAPRKVQQEPGRNDPQQRADLAALACGRAHHRP